MGEPGRRRRGPSARTVVVLLAGAVVVAVAVVLVLGLWERSSTGISADELAEGAEEALQAEAGARPAVSCPDGLAAEVGATARCTLTSGDDPEEYGVSVTVTSVDGRNFTVAVEVDEQPVE